MNTAQSFPLLASVVLTSWIGGMLALSRRRVLGILLLSAGCLCLGGFLVLIWITLERPPMRTLGETRLWYAFMLPVAAGLISYRWRLLWPLFYAVPLAGLFLGITWAHPESWDSTLMPALRSPWFVPHVLAYLLAYAFLSAAFVGSLRGWRAKGDEAKTAQAIAFADRSAQIGFGLLTLGLIIGAIWAKEAWGHYWTWDPKETWALLTWLAYLGYVHHRIQFPNKRASAFAFLAVAWVVLLLCWFGLNYMPIASQSVHSYAS
ncbi:cytochrome c biogenesis protein CcsA [Pelagicoccus sp. SDUM812003]|uniref:cytochrome c biogenesis protein n=1 Tax=Pelagicoccus sp. SDUM812003 TaxID=3041267 RepID=UPI00280D67B3|nr:cytochrome c biogenesis protein CcsA [Pelagicoccus sp. SDUM812003]MDQ8202922.1 cytochrome c biogenesis protein CcsA [Pelagicoccus sp. SDUM812003]